MDSLINLLKDFTLNNFDSGKAQINLSQKKFPQLLFNGHFYQLTNVKKLNPPFSWRCVAAKCNASGKTTGKSIGEQYDFEITNDNHIDESDMEATSTFYLKERRRMLKTKAALADEPPRKILNSVANFNYPVDVLANLPSFEADRLVITREKKKLEKNLKLIENNHIFCDGTFKVSPKLFSQLYTIHTLVEGCPLPVLFAFLPRKTQAIYEKLLSVIKDKISIYPKSVNVDFEQAFINASRNTFPGSIVNGCYFHFRKSFDLCVN
ncbi:unnamed protein product [Brachionus calyciflorus]|uniref:MULE transposase domain-containing protein n=1 Tax=Brachionus calyciflorus TaxID=104777 RepID=A0A814MYI2_9BILA|nr:unnamed protein product [Brachionus calyciflorus]